MSNLECYLFVGPTLYREDKALTIPPHIQVMPPVRRGDIERITAEAPPGVFVIVDGMFHQDLAVGHREIREAIEEGWRVWGLSSMGAIRAFEMAPFGMRGYGAVYDLFAGGRFEDFQDDEVALLHEAGPSYRPLTEPMAHLRAALDYLAEAGSLPDAGKERIIETLKGRWYGDRSLNWFSTLLTSEGVPPETVTAMRARFDQFRWKTTDLERFLESGLWKN